MGQVLRTLIDYNIYQEKEEDMAIDQGREKSEFLDLSMCNQWS